MAREGFVRARVDGELVDAAAPPELDKKRKHTVEVVIDRLVVRADLRQPPRGFARDRAQGRRRRGAGGAERGREFVLSSQPLACPNCGFALAELSPRLFSFNSPHGACPTCTGLGMVHEIDPEKLIADPDRSLAAGALAVLQESRRSFRWRQVQTLAEAMAFSLTKPWRLLSEAARRAVLFGTGDRELQFKFVGARSSWQYRAPFEGLVPALERRHHETSSHDTRAEIERFMSMRPCATCRGRRLRREALAVRVGDRAVDRVVEMSVKEALAWFAALELSPRERHIAAKILKEIADRLGFLASTSGLDYLTLDRTSGTLVGRRGAAHPAGDADRLAS